MPEIKHNFTAGKMNKDLDERLIPNGEYKDAMNIQVSTSEGSDVGTVQNILGNSIAPGQHFISDDAVCVGSIADEKNDKLYWFIINYESTEYITNGTFTGNADNWTHNGNPLDGTGGWDYADNNVSAVDVLKWASLKQSPVSITHGETYIIRVEILNHTGTGDLSPVIVDEFGGWTRPIQNLAATGDGIWEWTLDTSKDSIDQETSYTGNFGSQTPYSPSYIYFQNRMETGAGDPVTNKLNCNIDNISITGINNSCIIEYDTKNNKVTPVLVDTNNTILKLDPSKLITGINIIDDLLFWTDNNSEPKKINIQRCIQGTDPSGFRNTKLINSAQNLATDPANGDVVNIEEEHVAVAKQSPKHPLKLDYTTFRDVDGMYTGVMKVSDGTVPSSILNSSIGHINDFSFLEVGDTFRTVIETDINKSNDFNLRWNNWSPVVIKEFNDDIAPSVPISNYRIKGKITDWEGNRFTNTNLLLTENGDLSEGSGGIPDHWQNQGQWTWDQSAGTFTCSGLGTAINKKVYNSNDNGNIVEGKRYKVKYTIDPPIGGNLEGKLAVRLFGSGTGGGAALDGYYWNLGNVTAAGEFEFSEANGNEIVWTNTDGGLSTGPQGEWTFGNDTGVFLNSILFESKQEGSETYLGPETINTGASSVNYSSSNSVNLGNPTTLLVGGTQYTNPFSITNASTVAFDGAMARDIVDNTAYNSSFFKIRNIMDDTLEAGETYELQMDVTNFTWVGTGNGVMIDMGIGLSVASTSGAGYTHARFAHSTATYGEQLAQGASGNYTETFTATANKLDIRAHKNVSFDSFTVSVKKVSDQTFNGVVRDVSVEEIDDTQARVEIRVDSIDGDPPTPMGTDTELNYAIDKFDQEDRLFELKFPRFAYRYKYEDGEYSTMSPFTEVAFIPGAFDYHPKKGHNIGMSNNLKSLTLKDFNRLLPKDVKSIDLLYKEEHSPNIYIVDTIKDLTTTEYNIDKETIKNGLVPSNQLLRPWDNVPRKALAQDVVGNRIVYGNYLQNYDLVNNVSNLDFDLNLDVDVISSENRSRVGKNSIKSSREYQVGVVYTDKYGRETPVLTNADATVRLDKSVASEVNQLEVKVLGEGHPVNMKYFKFFVKDTGGEYYNLAMDRYYDAKDDNIWLAFPSTDRNKLDIDDYLILKKGVGDVIDPKGTNKWGIPNIIKEKAEYKILDIKNEAPDFIKRKETLIASIRHTSNASQKIFVDGDLPAANDINFKIDYDLIQNASFANLHEELGKDSEVEYHISLSNTDLNRTSDRYKVIQLEASGTSPSTYWHFTLEKPFTSEISVFTNNPSGENSFELTILNNTFLNIYRTAVDKSAFYKFDGRFFVKIYNDDVFRRALKDKQDEDTAPEYKRTGIARKIYSLETHSGSNRIKKHFDDSSITQVFKDIATDATNTGLSTEIVSNSTNTGDYANTFQWDKYYKATNDFAKSLGTLNGKRYNKDSNTHINDENLRDEGAWQDYDAYFRGINVNLSDSALEDRTIELDIHDNNKDDQKFEDVWFIDKAVSVGNFHHSNITSTGLGWDAHPSRTSTNSVGLTGTGTGIGILELSFGGIQPTRWSRTKNGWDARDESFFDLGEQNTHYSKTEAEFIEQIAIGSQFRFAEDPDHTIYTITSVDIFLRARYESLHDYSNQVSGFENTGEWEIENGHTHLRSVDLFPLHAKSRAGEPTGFRMDGGNYVSNVIGGSEKVTGYGFETDIEVETGDVIYKTSSYLRPSNYTKNWRLTLDKSFTGNWNPLDTGSDEISNGKTITLTATNVSAGVGQQNWVVVESIKDSTITDPYNNAKGDMLEVGMVLKKYASTTLTTPAIVSKIQPARGPATLEFPEGEILDPSGETLPIKIWFKTYDGADDFPSTGGRPAGIGAGNTLEFHQYPMNGLSPNSAKNLNFFRGGKGFDDSSSGSLKSGTDAIGYTLEWLEEKSSHSEEEILPPNPAIWETKPKENTDLDVYYEATGQIPIENFISTQSMLDVIPIGSIVEHLGSNTIPKETRVKEVDAGNKTITLTNDITIVSSSFATPTNRIT